MQNAQPILLVHGGAGAIPDHRVLVKLKGVRRAARKGYKVLRRSGSVLNAIVAAVEVMEEDTNFNAGIYKILSGLIVEINQFAIKK